MASPFNTPAPVQAATNAQIERAIVPAIADREWQNRPEVKYVQRIAVLNLAIGWALAPMADETPAEVSRVIHAAVGRGAPYGERVNAILAFLDTRHSIEDAEVDPGLYAPLTKQGASKLIDWMTTLPRRDRVERVAAGIAADRQAGRPSAEEVPAGRYAIDTNDGAVNELAFYKVDRPTEGRWAGYVFVKHIVGGDEERMSRAAGDAILAKIAEVGAEAASARYGHEIGECGMCGRQLTNDESRARGIGPICAAKAGW